MEILFLLEIPGVSVYHKDSAVGGVCNSICTDLTSLGHTVVTEEGLFRPEKNTPSLSIASANKQTRSIQSIKNILKKIPGFRLQIEKSKFSTLQSKLHVLKENALRQNKPDLIISWIGIYSDIGKQLKDHWNIPLVAIYDNPLIEEYSQLHKSQPYQIDLVKSREKAMLSGADCLILYSGEMGRRLKNDNTEIKKVVIQQFAAHELMHINSNNNSTKNTVEIQLIYIGSFLPWHRVPDLVNGFKSMLSAINKPITLHLVGKGIEFEKVKTQVTESGLEDKVILHGFKNGKELDDLLSMATVGIIPGCLWFHAPVKFMQYASAGMVVIAPSTPTLLEMNDNCDGTVFFDSPDEIPGLLLNLMKENTIENKLLKMRKLYENRFSPKAKQAFWRELLQQFE